MLRERTKARTAFLPPMVWITVNKCRLRNPSPSLCEYNFEDWIRSGQKNISTPKSVLAFYPISGRCFFGLDSAQRRTWVLGCHKQVPGWLPHAFSRWLTAEVTCIQDYRHKWTAGDVNRSGGRNRGSEGCHWYYRKKRKKIEVDTEIGAFGHWKRGHNGKVHRLSNSDSHF